MDPVLPCHLCFAKVLHSLVCPAPHVSQYISELSTSPVFFSRLQHTLACVTLPTHVGCSSLQGLSSRLFLSQLQAGCSPHTQCSVGGIIFPSTVLSHPGSESQLPLEQREQLWLLCMCSSEKASPDSVLKRIRKKQHSLSKPCPTNSIPALPSAKLQLQALPLISNAVNQAWHSSCGCQRRGLWLGRKGERHEEITGQNQRAYGSTKIFLASLQ